MTQDNMTHPPSSSNPTPPASGDRSGGSGPKRASPRRSRGAHEPSILRDYIESSKRKDGERKRPSVRAHKTSV
eukprot:CAMPEP_0172565828 /NCGR_PEP_ID=MMETSP1067-20121228/109670_1 /TAXON_ID=265564 ORGANISM="Thalassiosira punctigera, Strain Tpunct2005C2" /NCGR_SAMPLE_ID=MMETSP1067 /ASSEMBLY_ACC=CAM_ASM_000444 /LENGTH=72 /DNA_ID=CAMNT_0013356803 /DNA_START=15 /DNA_END=229 /DNA_ORIENTATION=+